MQSALLLLAGATVCAHARADADAAAPTSVYPPNDGNCTMQQKLRAIAPFPVAVVWIEKPGDTMDTIRQEFRLIKATGFSALKQLVFQSPLVVDPIALQNKTQAVMNAALDEGLIPWWYGIGGWACITQELLGQLGIPADTPMAAVQADARMIAYQTQVLRWRIGNMTFTPYTLGEPGAGNPTISPAQVPAFAAWLEQSYGSNITTLQAMWQDWYRGNLSQPEFSNFTEAAMLLMNPSPSHDYRRYRDSMRWQADALNAAFAAQLAQGYAHDPQEPQRTGGAMMLLNQAYYGWDMWGHAKTVEPYGSFYISSHLQWHYSEAQHEIDRPLYFSQRMTVDAGRSVWPGQWESTGGPGQYSGGFSTAVDGRIMRKLLLSYIAAGQRGIGLWTWNGRLKGQEAVEYQLVTIQGKPGPRAQAAGAVAQALDSWRFELWASEHKPVVGILYSWENEAVAGRLFMQSPPFECTFDDLDCKLFNAREMDSPALARLGWARALIDSGIPWVHVDETDVRSGQLDSLGLQALVLPHTMAMSTDLLSIIRDWQVRGGRVIADMPFLLMGNDSVVVDQATTDAASMFGCHVADFSSVETPVDGQGMALDIGQGAGPGQALGLYRGQYANLEMTYGRVAQTFEAPFDDLPAVVTASSPGTGNGSAAFINFEAGKANSRYISPSPNSYQPSTANATALSSWMVGLVTDGGRLGPGWGASPVGIPVYHRQAPVDGNASSTATAHHWFILYDDVVAAGLNVMGPGGSPSRPRNVSVTVSMGWATVQAVDVLSGADVPYSSSGQGSAATTTMTVTVPFRDALWIRTVEA